MQYPVVGCDNVNMGAFSWDTINTGPGPRTGDPRTREPEDPRTGDPRTQILEGCVGL